MVFEKPSLFEDALGLQTHITEVFRDPKSFRENNVPHLSKACTSYRRDVDMILEKLEDLSLHALDAMRRKLCMCPSSLYAEPCKKGSKKRLIGMLRTKIELIGDGMSENLARALRVGSLAAKLMNGQFDSTLPEFLEVPYEIEALQNEILKAVWSVPNLPLDEVKKLQLLPDLDAKVARNRFQIKNLLTGCLFQCDELKIPESILRAISTINSYGGEKTTKEKDPKSFRENNVPRLSKACTSYRCDVNMILEKLEDLSLHALDAMRRKLWMCPSSLYAEPCRNRNKKQLIGTLRTKIELIGDGMPENLARALRVGSLAVKLMNGHFDSTLPEFLEVPYEIEALQNDILKVVWSVPNLPPDEVKKLQLSPDLDAKVERNRSQIKNLLTECLFQCDELKIPESILRAISTISSYGGEKTTKEKIEDELICMLHMGSCMKQLVWDLSEHPNIDQQFWCAYKDESEIDDSSSNDDDDDDDDDDHVYDIDDKENYCSNYGKVDIPVGNESFAATHMEQQEDVCVAMRTSSITSKIPLPPENDEKCLLKEGLKNLRVMSGDKSLSEEHLHVLQECCHFMPVDEPFLPKKPEYLFPILSELTKSSLTNSDLSALQDVTGNEYLIIEGICDEVSLFPHKFIGCMMEKLIKAEGVHLDPASRSYLLAGTSVPEKQEGELQKPSVNDMGGLVFIQVVNELKPSFPKSGMRRLLEVLKQ